MYVAKYHYDPFEFSPNENPEAELPLTAGDYVLVVGDMDEVSSFHFTLFLCFISILSTTKDIDH